MGKYIGICCLIFMVFNCSESGLLTKLTDEQINMINGVWVQDMDHYSDENYIKKKFSWGESTYIYYSDVIDLNHDPPIWDAGGVFFLIKKIEIIDKNTYKIIVRPHPYPEDEPDPNVFAVIKFIDKDKFMVLDINLYELGDYKIPFEKVSGPN